MKQRAVHQYIDRESSEIRTEQLYGDRIVSFLYSTVRESAPSLYRALTSSRLSDALAYCNYDWPGALNMALRRDFLRCLDIDLGECVDPPEQLNSPRKIFERKIRYSQGFGRKLVDSDVKVRSTIAHAMPVCRPGTCFAGLRRSAWITS